MEWLDNILDQSFDGIRFADPMMFLLLLLPLSFLFVYSWDFKRQYSEVKFSNLNAVAKLRLAELRGNSKHLLLLFRVFAFCLLIIALARPQSFLNEDIMTTEGIDIVLATDVSGSMLTKDFKPNRLEASKVVAKDFVKMRPNDRIGLVVFAGQSFTMCPVTTDHNVLNMQISNVKHGLLIDQTAIGEGLERSVRRLLDSDAKSKVVILLTDGLNNYGEIHPMSATKMAKEEKVRVYTIGVGNDLDEELMKYIASETGGQYYQARDNNSLKRIYEEIDVLEKSLIQESVVQRVTEEFPPFVFWAGILLLMEILLRYTLFRSIP